MIETIGVKMIKKIAITGGIGSGKSTIAKFIATAGYPVFSCDQVNKELLKDKDYLLQLSKVFPNAFVQGELDKNLLAELVFQSKDGVEKMNAFSHPKIMDRLLENMNNANANIVFAEVPLLFEGGFENLFDEIIVVMRSKQNRIDSVCSRDKISQESVKARMCAQFDYDNARFEETEKIHIIHNDKDIGELDRETKVLLNKLTS